MEGEGFRGRQARQPTLGDPSCPARGASAPIAQTFQEKDAIPYFKRLYGPQTSDSLSSRPAGEVGSPHLHSVGKPSAHWEVSMETRWRGHGFSGVGSGVRGDLTSGAGFELQGSRLGDTDRQSSVWNPRANAIRALQCAQGWGQGSTQQRQGHGGWWIWRWDG